MRVDDVDIERREQPHQFADATQVRDGNIPDARRLDPVELHTRRRLGARGAGHQMHPVSAPQQFRREVGDLGFDAANAGRRPVADERNRQKGMRAAGHGRRGQDPEAPVAADGAGSSVAVAEGG